MQVVSIKNRSLIKALDTYANIIFNLTPSEVPDNLNYPKFNPPVDCEEGCSREYLDKRLAKPVVETGYPLHSLGFDINSASDKHNPVEWLSASNKLDTDIMKSIGVQFSALKMYYPKNGYIGWHNNCNCPGQNLLMTYSKGADGYFEYLDLKENKVIRIDDMPGWTAKVGYYGATHERDKIFWHCAKTYEPRITVSYVIRDQSMWEYMIEDIQSSQ